MVALLDKFREKRVLWDMWDTTMFLLCDFDRKGYTIMKTVLSMAGVDH
jgi:hypothetical protein